VHISDSAEVAPTIATEQMISIFSQYDEFSGVKQKIGRGNNQPTLLTPSCDDTIVFRIYP
jgi:hypothetical protein